MDKVITSERHQRALDYALSEIRASRVNGFVSDVLLYGSCARKTQKWDSDVDLFLVLREDTPNDSAFRGAVRKLQGSVTSPELFDPQVDMHITIGNEWETRDGMYYENLRKEGKTVWK